MSGVHYSNTPDNSATFPGSISMMQCNIPSLHYDGSLGYMLSTQTFPPLQEFALQSHYSLSNNSTSDEAEDHHQQHSVVDERKQRRMISNRESARRSRMRKQLQLDELWSQVIRLRNENQTLIERLSNMSVSCDKLARENYKLKEESSDLRQLLTGLQIGSPPPYIALQDLDEILCNTDCLRTASSTLSISSSMDMLH